MSSKGQRRKGNIQAASSAKAIELFDRDGQRASLLSFDGGGGTETNSPILQEGDMALALRKTGKKDPKTRSKGLRQLMSLVETRSMDEVEQSLHSFVALLPQLSMDGDVTVRCAAFRTTEAYILRLQKSVGKYLKKEIIPIFLMGMNDEARPVAQLAEGALSRCFPGEKRDAVIQLAGPSTVSLALDIVTSKSDLLTAQKYDEEENEQQRWNRLVGTALITLSNVDMDREQMMILFDDTNTLNKMATDPSVRRSLFVFFRRTMQYSNFPATVDQKLGGQVLKRLDDEIVSRLAFETWLLIASRPHFWITCNIDKALLPKFIALVRRKNSLWPVLQQYLIPSVRLICEHLSSDQVEGFISRLWLALFDGMPWEMTFRVDSWIDSVCQFICLAFSMDHGSVIMRTDDQMETLIRIVIEQKKEEIRIDFARSITPICARESMLVERISSHLCSMLPDSSNLIQHLLQVGGDDSFMTKQLIDTVLFHPKTDNILFCLVVDHHLRLSDSSSSSSIDHVQLSTLLSDRWKGALAEQRGDLLKCAIRVKSLLVQFDVDPFLQSISDRELMMALRDPSLSPSVVDQSRFERAIETVVMEEMMKKEGIDEMWWKWLCECLNGKISMEMFDRVLSRITVDAPFSLLLRWVMWNDRELDEAVKSGVNRRLITYSLTHHLKDDDAALFWSYITEKNVQAQEIVESIDLLLSSIDSDGLDMIVSFASRLSSSGHFKNAFHFSMEQLRSVGEKIDSQMIIPILVHAHCFCSNVFDPVAHSTEEIHLDFLLKKAYFHLCLITGQEEERLEDDTATILFIFLMISVVSLPEMMSGEWGDRLLAESRPITHNEKLRRSLIDDFLSIFPNDSPLCVLVALHRLAIGMEVDSLHSRLARAIIGETNKSRVEYLCSVSAAVERRLNEGMVMEAFRSDPLLYWMHMMQMECASLCSESIEKALTMLDLFLSGPRDQLEEVLFTHRESAFNCSLLKFLTALVPWMDHLGRSHRDFLCCGLVTAIQSIADENDDGIKSNASIVCFTKLTLRLFCVCAELARRRKADELFVDFIQEWNGFFVSACIENLIQWFFTASKEPLPELCSAIEHVDRSLLDTLRLPLRLDPALDCYKYSPKQQTLLLHIVPLLRHKTIAVQLAALRLLKCIVGEMFECENSSSDEGEILNPTVESRRVPHLLINQLDSTDQGPIPSSLLAWDAILYFLNGLANEKRPPFCANLVSFLDKTMHSLLSVIQHRFVSGRNDAMNRELFVSEYGVDEGEFDLEHWTCNLFYRTMITVPALVRQWYNGLPKSLATFVNKLTKQYVTPLVLASEFKTLAEQPKSDGSLKIRLREAVREIVAEYAMEDTTMRLPDDYPLSQVEVENERAVVSKQTKRRWLLHLTVFLNHQNGPIMEGIRMWKREIDRHLEGVEDCMICMSTISAISLQLPRITCKQCKKRFHGDCLWKWFETSNQSSCPLCRSSFVR